MSTSPGDILPNAWNWTTILKQIVLHVFVVRWMGLKERSQNGKGSKKHYKKNARPGNRTRGPRAADCGSIALLQRHPLRVGHDGFTGPLWCILASARQHAASSPTGPEATRAHTSLYHVDNTRYVASHTGTDSYCMDTRLYGR